MIKIHIENKDTDLYSTLTAKCGEQVTVAKEVNRENRIKMFANLLRPFDDQEISMEQTDKPTKTFLNKSDLTKFVENDESFNPVRVK